MRQDKPVKGFVGTSQPYTVGTKEHIAINVELVRDLVKSRLGITSTIRDTYLQAIIDGVVSELEAVQGLALNGSIPHHLMFVVDYATWRYQNVTDSAQVPGRTPVTMPRHLQFRLHNLIIKQAGDADV